MPWFRVDDGFADSKPVMNIPEGWRLKAIGVWTLCGAWSTKEMRDGYVPMDVVKRFGGTPRVVRALIEEAELWTEATDGKTKGIQFSNWSKWQTTRERLLEIRESSARRKAAWRQDEQKKLEKSWKKVGNFSEKSSGKVERQNGSTSTDSEMSRRDSRCDPNTSTNRYNLPLAVTPELGGGSGGNPTASRKRSANSTRGTRLALDWHPSDAVWSQMRTEHPNVDLEFETKKFIDYWTSKAGANSAKLDWDKTWRNWIRTASERQPVNRNGHTPIVSTVDNKVNGWLNMKIGQTRQKELP